MLLGAHFDPNPPRLLFYSWLPLGINLVTQPHVEPLISPLFKVTSVTKYTKFGILPHLLTLLTSNLRVLFLEFRHTKIMVSVAVSWIHNCFGAVIHDCEIHVKGTSQKSQDFSESLTEGHLRRYDSVINIF